MVTFLSIDSKEKDAAALQKLDDALAGKQHPVFLLVYMEGCGPCNATRPEWAKLKNVLKGLPSEVVVADVNKDAVDGLKHFHHQLAGFPTMLLFSPGKKDPLAYEDAEDIGEKDRTVDSFVRWVKQHAGKQSGGRKITRRARHGRRWSAKYKRSINCRRPRGFSQRQYCRYGRRRSSHRRRR